MDKYISKNELLKVVQSNVAEADSFEERCAQILEAILNAPTADVVPKSEVESIITLNSQLEAKVFEQRKEIERLKKYNTDVAFKHYNDGKAELASEIFAEIDSKILAEIDLCNGVLIEFEEADEPYHRIKGEVSALCKIQDFIAELKRNTRRANNEIT